MPLCYIQTHAGWHLSKPLRPASTWEARLLVPALSLRMHHCVQQLHGRIKVVLLPVLAAQEGHGDLRRRTRAAHKPRWDTPCLRT